MFEEPVEEVFAYGVVESCEKVGEHTEDPAKFKRSLDEQLSSPSSLKSLEG